MTDTSACAARGKKKRQREALPFRRCTQKEVCQEAPYSLEEMGSPGGSVWERQILDA